MEAVVGFYRQLGFDVEPYDTGYTIISLSGEEVLHPRIVDGVDTAKNGASVYFHVQDVDSVQVEWAGNGVVTGEVVDQPWGCASSVSPTLPAT